MPVQNFSFLLGEYNITGSINKFFRDNINLVTPSFAVSFAVNYDYPDVPLFDEEHGDYAPKFSVTQLGRYDTPGTGTQGDLLDNGMRGQKVNGVTEISCWVNGKNAAQTMNIQWSAQLKQMRDMVVKLFSGTRTIPVVDLYTNMFAPPGTNYIIRVEGVQEVAVGPDPNPNIHRRRMLLSYCYYQRQ